MSRFELLTGGSTWDLTDRGLVRFVKWIESHSMTVDNQGGCLVIDNGMGDRMASRSVPAIREWMGY